MRKESKKFFLSCLYLGFIPFAPGTWGSLFSLFVNVLFHETWIFSWIVLLIIFIISVFFIKQFDDEVDPSWIVVDEFLGMMLCLLLIKTWGPYWNLLSLSLAFGFFRLFDIWKPFPISTIDQMLLSHKKNSSFGSYC